MSALIHHVTTLRYDLGIHTGTRQTSHKEATKLTVSPTAAQRVGFARYYCNTPDSPGLKAVTRPKSSNPAKCRLAMGADHGATTFTLGW